MYNLVICLVEKDKTTYEVISALGKLYLSRSFPFFSSPLMLEAYRGFTLILTLFLYYKQLKTLTAGALFNVSHPSHDQSTYNTLPASCQCYMSVLGIGDMSPVAVEQ